jgi:membrane protein implicated in regulation of membrane protease activity
MRLKFPLLLGVLLAILVLPAFAHHGWNGNEEEQFELTGTVEEAVSLAGPHATMKIRVKDQVWDITLAPPARTKRAGLEEATIPVGAKVTVSGHRSSDTQRFEMKTERVTYNGTTYDVYPDRD